MSGLRGFYDHHARNYSRNWALAQTLIFSVFPLLGVVQLVRYSHHGDSFHLMTGIFNMLLGYAGVIHGALIMHAVARRNKVESHSGR